MQSKNTSPDTSLIESSFKYCEKIAKQHYENFPVGSILVPKKKRNYVWSIYAFARYADDIADSEDDSPEVKLTKLNTLDKELDDIYSGNFDGIRDNTAKFLISLWKTKEDLSIPKQEFSDLLTAFKQDSVKQRYETFDELLEYSRYSANPIGHLVLYVFGYHPNTDKLMYQRSDDICTALQLTNFWQDVSVDLEMGRIYIPAQIILKYGYSYDEMHKKIEDDRFVKIMKELVDKTELIFNSGAHLIPDLKGRLKLEIKATYLGGNRILKMIKDINYKVLSERVKLTKSDTISIFTRTLFGKV